MLSLSASASASSSSSSYSNDASGDFEKLQLALRQLTHMFGSLDALLEAFGLSHMPAAQRYGIMFGCLVFVLTVTAVIALLVLGGSFQRIAEQAETGQVTLLSAAQTRAQRALIMETILDGRDRMTRHNVPTPAKLYDSQTEFTPLTRMLQNEAPDPPFASVDQVAAEGRNSGGEREEGTDHPSENDPPNLQDEAKADSMVGTPNKKTRERYIPAQYEKNYMLAYRKCQDRPGGAILSGRPEARFEAYARAYAGCGPFTALWYRRSYARTYEAITCVSVAADDQATVQFQLRPHDIVGRFVSLQVLTVQDHLQSLFQVTNGHVWGEHKSYEADEVWGFLEDGPFPKPDAMCNSFVFQRHLDEAAFAFVSRITGQVLGAVLLTKDDPRHLTIQIECPIQHPSQDGTKEQLEAYFLLLDRLFGFGYRRIQFSVDAQDARNRKLATRLGMTLEGVLLKHMIVKDASRDSHVYSMLNSDWRRGARSSLFGRLYGPIALRLDRSQEQMEEEADEQSRVLREQKEQQQQQLQQQQPPIDKKNA